jgi:hypothetical protein
MTRPGLMHTHAWGVPCLVHTHALAVRPVLGVRMVCECADWAVLLAWLLA